MVKWLNTNWRLFLRTKRWPQHEGRQRCIELHLRSFTKWLSGSGTQRFNIADSTACHSEHHKYITTAAQILRTLRKTSATLYQSEQHHRRANIEFNVNINCT